MLTKSHHFFLLISRPWPILSRICSFNLIFSLLIFFKFGSFRGFSISLFILFLTRMYWWLSYSREFHLEGRNSFNLEKGLKIGIILFISSEIFFFFSFFWSYFHYFLAPSIETGLAWPPAYVLSFDCTNVPLINTLVLMGSGVTVTVAHHYFTCAKSGLFNLFLLLTIFMGFVFTILQAMEYNSSFFSLRDSTYGTVFFMLTGFHGIHVIVGSLFLSVCLFRSLKSLSSNLRFTRFELSSWYWHFVDVVWIFLYFLIYYLNT